MNVATVKNGPGVQQLRIAEPVEFHNQVGTQDRQQHVAAANERRSNFQKVNEDWQQAQSSARAAASQADPRAQSRAVACEPLPFSKHHPEKSSTDQQGHCRNSHDCQQHHNQSEGGERDAAQRRLAQVPYAH
jgi:hypothetical protein